MPGRLGKVTFFTEKEYFWIDHYIGHEWIFFSRFVCHSIDMQFVFELLELPPTYKTRTLPPKVLSDETSPDWPRISSIGAARAEAHF
jgi:hypothetical protein